MKTFRSLPALLVAAAAIAVTSLTLASLIPAEAAFAGLVVLGIATFALVDYSRPVASLTVSAAVLRPSLPSASATPATPRAHRAA